MSISLEPGAPVPSGTIPLCVPVLHGNEWIYIKECLDTGWVSSVGSYVSRFEQQMAAYLGVDHSVATVNGTAAIHVALLAVGVQPDDEVIVSTLTFIAPANAIRYIGAWPVFMDAESTYWEMDVTKVEQFLTEECEWVADELRNRQTHRRVRAIMPVHILGHPVDMDPLLDLARRYRLPVVEDATESLAGTYKSRKVGNLADIACLSFNGNKLITTGGGGMIVTNNPDLAKKARYLTTQAKDNPLEAIHNEIGYNYRLTNIQAALGCAQLEQIEAYAAAKRRIAATYACAFEDVPGITPMKQAPWAESAYWMYTVLVDPAEYGMDSRALLRTLGDQGIQTRPFWQPIHLSRAHHNAQPRPNPVAEWLYRHGLSLPCSVNLSSDQQEQVIEQVSKNRK